MRYWQLLVALSWLAAAFIFVYIVGFRPVSFTLPHPMTASTKTISIGTTTLRVAIADTEALRRQGLSGRGSLPQGSGMLFVFDKDTEEGFWMKDMKFSIDIIWLTRDGEVVTIAPDVSPDTFPNAFYPSKPARYTLEVPAGFAVAHKIVVGSKFVLQ